MQAPSVLDVRPAPDQRSGPVGDRHRGGEHLRVAAARRAPRPARRRRRSRRARAQRSWCRRCRCRASRGHLTTEEGQQGARHGGRAAEGLDVGAAARPAALDEHDVVARSAQPVDHGECRVAGARPPGRRPRPARPAGTSASATVAPRAAGPHATPPTARLAVLPTCTTASGPREASQARAASLTRKARATVSSGRRRGRDVGADAGPRHPLCRRRPRGRAPARRPRPPGARAADPACTAARRRRARRRRSPAVVPEPRQSRSTPATRARTAASGMPVSALAPAMSRASLTMTPSKPSSSRSTPITVRENVAGWSRVEAPRR